MNHSPTPWRKSNYSVGQMEGIESKLGATCAGAYELADVELIVSCVNAHAMLVAACEAALRYHDAIAQCANSPEKMASFCTAEGDDLDALYTAWQVAATVALNPRRLI